MRALGLVAMLCACNGFDAPAQPMAGGRPFANAGTGSSYPLGTIVTLDGSRSFDPDGDLIAHHWSVVQRPTGSSGAPADADAATTTFGLDHIGTYRLQLVVTDDAQNTDSSTLRIVSTGAITTIDAGPDATVAWLDTVQLSGTVTTMSGFTATYLWEIVSRPPGSVAPVLNAGTLTPTFMADAVGTYTITLSARVGDEVREDTVNVEVTSTGVALGSNIVAYAYTKNSNRILYARDVGHAELVSYDPATATTATANVGAFTPRAIAIDDTGQSVGIGGPGIVVIRSAANLALISQRSVPGCTAAHITLPTQSYRVDCFPVDGTIEPIRSVNMGTGAVTEIPCPVKAPDVAITVGYMYMVDGASSELYLYDAYATPPLPVVGHVTVPGSAPPVIPAGGSNPYVVIGNGLAVDGGGTVRYDLHIPISAGAYGWNGELAVVSGDQLEVFATGYSQATLKLTVGLPHVNGEAPVGRFVAYSSDNKRLFVVAATSAGDVLYMVPR